MSEASSLLGKHTLAMPVRVHTPAMLDADPISDIPGIDHQGRVISSRFASGQVSQFRYGQDGSLYGFTYARLAWSTSDGTHWLASDQHSTYVFEGRVLADPDGAIRLERPDRVRHLKLNGAIEDQYTNGTFSEILRPGGEPTPQDLLAVAGPKRVEISQPAQVAASIRTTGFENTQSSAQTSEEDESVSATGRKFIVQGVRIKKMRAAQEVAEATTNSKPAKSSNTRLAIATYALKFIESWRGEHSLLLVSPLDELASIAYERGRMDESRVLHERALHIRRTRLGVKHSDTGINLHGLGRVYQQWGRAAEAERLYLESVRLLEDGLRKSKFMRQLGVGKEMQTGVHLNRLVESLHSLATLYHQQNKRHLCQSLHQTARDATQSVPEKFIRNTKPALDKLAAMSAPLPLDKQPLDQKRRIALGQAQESELAISRR